MPTPKRHIAKWPFFVGDALLVATGIGLAFSQGAPLPPLAMAWVVISIVSGAALACTPYVVEYYVTAKHGGGDWAEVRNHVMKLEFRLAEMELNNGGAPESARLAQSRFNRYSDDEDLGIGEVVKQQKPEEPESKPAATQLKFGPTGADLVGKKHEPEPETVAPEPIEESEPEPLAKPKSKPPFRISKAPLADSDLDEEEANLPTSLDDIGPAEKRTPTHLRKALEQARKETGSKAVSRLIRGGKS